MKNTHEITEYLPKISISTDLKINKFDAEMFLAYMEADIVVFSGINNETSKDRVKTLTPHYEALCKLFGVESKLEKPYN